MSERFKYHLSSEYKFPEHSPVIRFLVDHGFQVTYSKPYTVYCVISEIKKRPLNYQHDQNFAKYLLYTISSMPSVV